MRTTGDPCPAGERAPHAPHAPAPYTRNRTTHTPAATTPSTLEQPPPTPAETPQPEPAPARTKRKTHAPARRPQAGDEWRVRPQGRPRPPAPAPAGATSAEQHRTRRRYHPHAPASHTYAHAGTLRRTPTALAGTTSTACACRGDPSRATPHPPALPPARTGKPHLHPRGHPPADTDCACGDDLDRLRLQGRPRPSDTALAGATTRARRQATPDPTRAPSGGHRLRLRAGGACKADLGPLRPQDRPRTPAAARANSDSGDHTGDLRLPATAGQPRTPATARVASGFGGCEGNRGRLWSPTPAGPVAAAPGTIADTDADTDAGAWAVVGALRVRSWGWFAPVMSATFD
ncbi:hypothetical protein EHYA_07800 [Embleya hyalina]|uniref:Uncharacterized protein n=1 Tax=Embleya hyalina TaxID=516124 RepID=A0A401YZK0_9ACTN|nr:hypothetical protein EHYA_07800 [Embleya hyalina]